MSRTASTSKKLFSVLAACLIPACAMDAQAPVVEADGEYLYGLTGDEIASLLPLASKPYDLDTWLEIHRGPFDCANYGSMCRQVGPDAAYTITERSYDMALDGAGREEIDAFLAEALDAAAVEWEAQNAEARDDARDSAVDYGYGGANNERVKVEIFATKPLVGTWNAQTECTYQTKGAFGVWGGSQDADMIAYLNGHLHDVNGNIYQPNPASGQYCTDGNPATAACNRINAHQITTVKIYFYPDVVTDDIHAFGECDAVRGSWSGSADANVTNN
jgi:hypothetical protein